MPSNSEHNYFSASSRIVQHIRYLIAILLKLISITLHRVISQMSVKARTAANNRHYRLQFPITTKLY